MRSRIDFWIRERGSTVWHPVLPPKSGCAEETACGINTETIYDGDHETTNVLGTGDECSVCASELATTVPAGRIA
jgi:hypothetical protein